MDDLELVARPVNYLSYEMKADDGNTHNVELYIEVSPRWAMNLPNQLSVSETLLKMVLFFSKVVRSNRISLVRKAMMFVLIGDISI